MGLFTDFKGCREMFEPDWKKDEMMVFDENHEGAIINVMAAGMSMSEVVDYFGGILGELNAEDKRFFLFHYKQGRADANKKAVHALFNQMSQRGGGQVALSYLIRFGDDWEEKPEGDKEQSGKRSFRVVLD